MSAEKFSLEIRRRFPAARLSPAGGGLASGLCVMRCGILKEKNFHPISVRTSLPCLLALAGAWVAGVPVLPSKSLNRSPAAPSPFCCVKGYARTSLLPRAKSNTVPEYRHVHKGTGTFELCLLGFI